MACDCPFCVPPTRTSFPIPVLFHEQASRSGQPAMWMWLVGPEQLVGPDGLLSFEEAARLAKLHLGMEAGVEELMRMAGVKIAMDGTTIGSAMSFQHSFPPLLDPEAPDRKCFSFERDAAVCRRFVQVAPSTPRKRQAGGDVCSPESSDSGSPEDPSVVVSFGTANPSAVERILRYRKRLMWDEETVEELIKYGAMLKIDRIDEDRRTGYAICHFIQPNGPPVPFRVPRVMLKELV